MMKPEQGEWCVEITREEKYRVKVRADTEDEAIEAAATKLLFNSDHPDIRLEYCENTKYHAIKW